jgi:hypothetical protein
LIEELPYHIENLEARQDLEKNASNIIGEKPNEGIRCPALCCKISKLQVPHQVLFFFLFLKGCKSPERIIFQRIPKV